MQRFNVRLEGRAFPMVQLVVEQLLNAYHLAGDVMGKKIVQMGVMSRNAMV